jgi:hypothetical protein
MSKYFDYSNDGPSKFDKDLYKKINDGFEHNTRDFKDVFEYKKGGCVGEYADGEDVIEGVPHKKGMDIKIKHPGALHKELGIPENKKIPTKKIDSELSKAKKDDDTTLEKRLVFAKNARKWNHD